MLVCIIDIDLTYYSASLSVVVQSLNTSPTVRNCTQVQNYCQSLNSLKVFDHGNEWLITFKNPETKINFKMGQWHIYSSHFTVLTTKTVEMIHSSLKILQLI